MTLSLNKASSANLKNDLETINTFNSTPGEGTTRVLFTPEELEARAYVKNRMEELGMTVYEDAIGNIFGKLPGSKPSLSPVWTGSHIDTVLHGGQFDGMAGVVSGLEAIRLIKESGLPRKRNIEVIVFTSEEPTRFGLGCIGSRALAGKLTLADTAQLLDDTGKSLKDLLNDLDYDETKFPLIQKKKGDVFAFVELHIEQAEILESLQIPVGIVTTISAPTELEVSVYGRQQHAGSTTMEQRSDAMVAAAEIVTTVEKFAKEFLEPSTVATIGKLNVYPNSSNVIPGKVVFTIDIRSSRMDDKNVFLAELKEYFQKLQEQRSISIDAELICHDAPADAAPRILNLIENACQNHYLPYHKMISGAFHDAMMVAQFAPFGMIFVPSKDGISHDKREWTDYEDIAKGTDVLAEVLYKLSCED